MVSASGSAARRRVFGFQRRHYISIGLLPGDAPVAEFIERDVFAGHGADDVGAGHEDLEIAVEIANLRLAVSMSLKRFIGCRP